MTTRNHRRRPRGRLCLGVAAVFIGSVVAVQRRS
jgi:hypothetical protein